MIYLVLLFLTAIPAQQQFSSLFLLVNGATIIAKNIQRTLLETRTIQIGTNTSMNVTMIQAQKK